jgi:CheY-like chemotaxis protein
MSADQIDRTVHLAGITPANQEATLRHGEQAKSAATTLVVPRMKKKILISDDDAGVRESLAFLFESEQYEVAQAGSGREAVAKFINERPDLVLLDLAMPGKDGWEVFQTMSWFNPFLPVIVITARPHQYERAVDAGIDALMEKPLDLELLLQAIEHLLAEPQAIRFARLTDRQFKTAYLQRREGSRNASTI